MKKVILPALVMATALFASCGPNAEELAKKAQATADSIIAAEMQLHMEDSLAMVAANATAMADSLMKVAEQTKADSIANAAVGTKITVKKIVKKVVIKAGTGKGEGKISTTVKAGTGKGEGKISTTVKAGQGKG